jgi:AhpD family alkylhydroperoxidase
MTKVFDRRIYHSLGELLTDLRHILSQRKVVRALMRGDVIAPAFRERLMLVVTGVNRCRYCSYVHARAALSKGISQVEIEALGEGLFAGSLPEELPALLYAQHWAETGGQPDGEARQHLLEFYGEQAMEMIELALRIIRTGNLTGNTVDCLLQRMSFGRLAHR